ncbi:MAG: hypothetical protein HKN20_15755 [Gemmatimonadetes bacterium]|nr:hypothetical protein [Gemmatimonadota bacterium]
MHTNLTILSLAYLILLSIPMAASAEIVPTPERDAAIGLEGSSPLAGGSGEACTIVYYNYCSGWIQLFDGFLQGDKAGVVYDLAEDCNGGEGHNCTNLGNWWYWRYTFNGYCGYGFEVSYQMYDVDANDCLIGAPVGSVASTCPLERWNSVPGMGSTSSDRVALVATWEDGTLPYLATDNNVYNASGGPACSGVGVGDGTSYAWLVTGAGLCPPTLLEDELGPVDIIAISMWNCMSTTATQSSSWSDLKALFQ